MTEVVAACRARGIDLAGFVRENEARLGLGGDGVDRRLDLLWAAMEDAIARGLRTRGVLPGPLVLARRAPGMYEELRHRARERQVLSWETAQASVYAIAVAEENAAGGRVVTAPTCGSAGGCQRP
ncbi:MAG: L-serine ammonia-lyase, iron-sulfur-dependent, subunit alpha [Candidatus Acetothermia bacterium]|jgi:L-serine dehydratase|nr:L-serine ammonia-lyase, iron-sulfur-dependent, subunit alpha [Candidatus Acetothermia bacterium]